jgi:hypothetical protein
MPKPVSLLTLQFLAWLADRPRSYAEVMEAWRSSCPRISVWEDALADGLVRPSGRSDRPVTLTQEGKAVLHRAAMPADASARR